MFENFVLTSKKNKAREFYTALSRHFPQLNKKDFIDYIWLAEKSPAHNTDDLHVICRDVVWPMLRGDYIMLHERGEVVGYTSWGFFSKGAKKPTSREDYEDYGLDKEIWLLDVIAPYGHTKKMIALLLQRKKELGYNNITINFRRWYANQNKERVNKVDI